MAQSFVEGVFVSDNCDSPRRVLSEAAKRVVAAREARFENARRRRNDVVTFSPLALKRAPNGPAPRVTLLVPTYNRNAFVARQLDYLDRHFDPAFFAVSILDGSSETAAIEENKRLASHHNVSYKWYDSSVATGYDRLVDRLSEIDTDYAQFMPDDDYFCEDTMRRHVTLLDENPEAVGAYGHAASFSTVFKHDGSPNCTQLGFDFERNTVTDNEDEPLQRIFKSFFAKSRAAYYSLHRTDVLLRAVVAAKRGSVLNDICRNGKSEIDMDCFYFGDIIMYAVPLMMGKKINSGLPMVAFQIGNSFDSATRKNPPEMEGADKGGDLSASISIAEELNHAPRSQLNGRQPHHKLPLHKEFRYPERAELLITVLTDEYEQLHRTGRPDAIDRFFRELVMSWLGSIGTGGMHAISALNRALLDIYSVTSPGSKVRQNLLLNHDILNVEANHTTCEICEIAHSKLCEEIKRQYAFLLRELRYINGTSRFRVQQQDRPEIEIAKFLYKSHQPNPEQPNSTIHVLTTGDSDPPGRAGNLTG